MPIKHFIYSQIALASKQRKTLKDGRKHHCCLYCLKWIYSIPEHMKGYHSDKVKEILKMKPADRNKKFKRLR